MKTTLTLKTQFALAGVIIGLSVAVAGLSLVVLSVCGA